MELSRRPLSTKEINSLKRSLCLAQQKVKDLFGRRNTFGDRAVITDEIRVYEGTGENKKLKFASKGHIVNVGLVHIINAMCANSTAYSQAYTSNGWVGLSTYTRVGTGGNVTTGTITNLTTPSTIPPSSQAGVTSSPQGGTYRCAWTATWNAGTLTAITITELGLFLDLVGTLQAFAWNLTAGSVQLFSRLSAADGDFSQFTVNPAVPLTIEWRMTVTFA